jgi:hypothetical protein
MLSAISRYQAGIIPKVGQTLAALRERGELVLGRHLPLCERALAHDVGAEQTTTSIRLTACSSLSMEEGDGIASVVRNAVQST